MTLEENNKIHRYRSPTSLIILLFWKMLLMLPRGRKMVSAGFPSGDFATAFMNEGSHDLLSFPLKKQFGPHFISKNICSALV